MAAPAETRIFGMRIGLDPKILVGILVVVAGAIFWYNTRSDDESTPAAASANRGVSSPAQPLAPPRVIAPRRTRTTNDDATLRLRPIDASRGDVDPTLRLDLLARLQNVQPETSGRSLFEVGPAPLSPADQKMLKNPPVVPKVPPQPAVAVAGPMIPTEQPLNIPLKYYGFVKTDEKNPGNNQGLFLDGDNIVVGSEGETIMNRYLIVSLTPTSARLEDPQLKKGQTLSVVPAATP
jgi:hypothetical protein